MEPVPSPPVTTVPSPPMSQASLPDTASVVVLVQDTVSALSTEQDMCTVGAGVGAAVGFGVGGTGVGVGRGVGVAPGRVGAAVPVGGWVMCGAVVDATLGLGLAATPGPVVGPPDGAAVPAPATTPVGIGVG